MKNLSNFSLIKLFPENFRDDLEIKCFSKAFDIIYPVFFEKICKIKLFSRVESFTETECDFFANELKVDFYELNWTLEQKRTAVLNAFYFKLYKGTAGVISEYIYKLYNSATVKEWFDYNGLTYHFKIAINNLDTVLDNYLIQSFEKIIEKLKPVSRKCDAIEITNAITSDIKINALVGFVEGVMSEYDCR